MHWNIVTAGLKSGGQEVDSLAWSHAADLFNDVFIAFEILLLLGFGENSSNQQVSIFPQNDRQTDRQTAGGH